MERVTWVGVGEGVKTRVGDAEGLLVAVDVEVGVRLLMGRAKVAVGDADGVPVEPTAEVGDGDRVRVAVGVGVEVEVFPVVGVAVGTGDPEAGGGYFQIPKQLPEL